MKKILGLLLAIAMCLSLAACGGSATPSSTGTASTPASSAPATTAAGDTGTPASKPITIRLSGAFAEGSDHYYYFKTFCDSVSERSNGSLTVVWGHGPEAIPTDQIAEAMQNGVVELVYSPIAYLVTVLPGLAALKLTDPAKMRASGGTDYVNSLTNEVLKSQYLARTQDGAYFVMCVNKEIKTVADLKGMTIRSASATKPLVASVGAEMVTMGWADVYQALQKNVVQGAGGTLKDFIDNDLGSAVKYLLLPGVYNSDSSLMITNGTWDKLDDAQKDALKQSAIDWEKDSKNHNEAANKKSIEELKAAGVTVIEMGADYAKGAYDTAWAEASKADEAVVNQLKSFAGF